MYSVLVAVLNGIYRLTLSYNSCLYNSRFSARFQNSCCQTGIVMNPHEFNTLKIITKTALFTLNIC